MPRLALLLALGLLAVLVLAPEALADRIDGGEGAYGETDDAAVTNAGFILIAAFPLIALIGSLIQWRLDKRKQARKQAQKAAARGGW